MQNMEKQIVDMHQALSPKDQEELKKFGEEHFPEIKLE